jgi:hypothetical protein
MLRQNQKPVKKENKNQFVTYKNNWSIERRTTGFVHPKSIWINLHDHEENL